MEEKRSYHHKNLRNALIERAIEVVTSEGEQSLSLRKIAADCGVSYAAPYAHFKDKDELLSTCRNYVSNEFSKFLSNSIEGRDPADPETLNILGYAYIGFFKTRPVYFSFLYGCRESYKFVLTLEEVENNYPPFEVFRKVCVALAEKFHLTRQDALARLIKCWSFVHGAAELIVSPNVELNGSWDSYLEILFR